MGTLSPSGVRMFTRRLTACLIVTCLHLLNLTGPARSQWVQSIASRGARASSVVVSGASLFAGTTGGVFRSSDNGATWMFAGSGLPGYGVSALAVNGGALLAGTYGGGIYRSTDEGLNWSSASVGVTDPAITCIAVCGGEVLAGTISDGIFISTDNGTTWGASNAGLRNLDVSCLALAGSVLYAGSFSGLSRSTDLGSTWIAANYGLTDSSVNCLSVSEERLYAGTTQGVFASGDSAGHWTAASSGLPGIYVSSIVSVGAGLFAGTLDGEVFFSTDNGSTWTPKNSGLTGAYVDAFAAAGANVFAATWGGGVFRTADDGATWIPVNSGMTSYTIFALATIGANVVAGTNGGMFLSTDQGISWLASSAGLSKAGATPAVRSLLTAGAKLFAGTDTGLYVSTSGGATWVGITPGPAGGRVAALASSGQTIYAGTTNGVEVSGDGGADWYAAGLAGTSVSAIAASGSNVFAGTDSAGVFLSTDAGASWAPVNAGIQSTHISSIAINGLNVLVGTTDRALFLSTDCGRNWTLSRPSGPEFTAWTVPALFEYGADVFAGTQIGIFLSTNGGVSWKAKSGGDEGLNYTQVNSLTVSGAYVFAGTQFSGLWRRPLSEMMPSTGHWTRVNVGLKDSTVTALATLGSALFAGTDTSGVFRSTDGGSTWEETNNGLGHRGIRALFARGSALYAGTTSGDAVWFSTNSGDAWVQAPQGLSGAAVTGFASSDSVLYAITDAHDVYAMKGDAGWTRVFRGTLCLAASGSSVFTGMANTISFSTDIGVTWWPIPNHLPLQAELWSLDATDSFLYAVCGSSDAGNSAIFRISKDGTELSGVGTTFADSWVQGIKVIGTRLFAGTFNDGVFLSTDGGATWKRTGSPDSHTGTLVTSGSVLFQGTSSGVYRLSLSDILPIQLASFQVRRTSGVSAVVQWTTASEVNNYGFFVQESSNLHDWIDAGGLVHGQGTTLEAHQYQVTVNLSAGSWWLRLVQIDLDGTKTFYDPQIVQIDAPMAFGLDQNYPNPFNPTTTIRYTLATRSEVALIVYNLLGQEVRTLVNQIEESGAHQVKFDGSGLATGAYFYRLKAGASVATKKLLLIH